MLVIPAPVIATRWSASLFGRAVARTRFSSSDFGLRALLWKCGQKRWWYHAAMDAPGEWRGSAAAIAPGQSAIFRIQCGTRTLNGFLVNYAGEYHAYVNRCAHTGTPLDTWPNDFFSEDGRYLVCSTHGATYLPESGLCVGGPCPGAKLERLSLRRDGDALIVSCP